MDYRSGLYIRVTLHGSTHLMVLGKGKYFGLHKDNGKEKGTYYLIAGYMLLGVIVGNKEYVIGVIVGNKEILWGLYRDHIQHSLLRASKHKK